MHDATVELHKRLNGRLPRIAFVLGSGLGALVAQLKDTIQIPFDELEGFPKSGVSGHAGELVAGTLNGQEVIMLSGRVHYYEQGDASAMRLPLTVLHEAGITHLILTNSAGSVSKEMPPASVMMIEDHINYSGMNPLIGEESDARFVGMTSAYDKPLQNNFLKVAEDLDIPLSKGVYMWFSGPSFETPSEVKMAAILGANAVGMSTVPEVILARFLGLKVGAFSVITNFGAGINGAELSHDETKEMAPKGGKVLGSLLSAWLKEAHL